LFYLRKQLLAYVIRVAKKPHGVRFYLLTFTQ